MIKERYLMPVLTGFKFFGKLKIAESLSQFQRSWFRNGIVQPYNGGLGGEFDTDLHIADAIKHWDLQLSDCF